LAKLNPLLVKEKNLILGQKRNFGPFQGQPRKNADAPVRTSVQK